jgi:GDPmannose 4,6-dehydratase
VSTLITGISGQDGGYLAQLLMDAGENIIGTMRPGSAARPHVQALKAHRQCELTSIDLSNPAALRGLLRNTMPERVIHLAAVSQPHDCDADPILSHTINVSSAEVILDWQRREQPQGRVLLLSSSAIFGEPHGQPVTEESPRVANSEYARQKLEVAMLAAQAREAGMYVSCAIPFTHESPRRSENFVFAKIINSAARLKLGQQQQLQLGSLSGLRDWGYAPEYVQAFTWMLDMEQPLELVISTGQFHSVGGLVNDVFNELGLDPTRYLRFAGGALRHPENLPQLQLPSRAWTELGWEPQTSYATLWRLLLQSAMARFVA